MNNQFTVKIESIYFAQEPYETNEMDTIIIQSDNVQFIDMIIYNIKKEVGELIHEYYIYLFTNGKWHKSNDLLEILD